MQLFGLGAFTVGGDGGGSGQSSYGQGVTSDAVTQIISGPATDLMNLSGVSAQSDLLTMISNYLSTLPLQALQMFKPFLPGKTAADFVDVPTSVTTIMNALGLGALSSTSKAIANLMQDVTVLFDVFHTTYQAGTSTDAPGTLGTNGKPTWFSCWNDILSMVGLWTNTSTPTTPAPAIGNVMTRVTNDLLILLDVFHLTYTSTQWNNAWTDLLALFGIVNATSAPTNPTPTIGPSITSAQATATTAATNASIAIASNQATNDAIVSATTGAPVTGTSTTDVTTGLSNIPATNVVGLTGAAVAFGAVGGGNSNNNSGGTTDSLTWTHTIATGDLGVLVFVAVNIATGQTVTTSVTYGGTAMTLLGSEPSSALGTGFTILQAWWLKAPASGSKTVVASASGANINFMTGDSVSYSASKVVNVGLNTGGGSASLSMSAASVTGNMVVGAFANYTNFTAVAMSAYSQTQRYNSGASSIEMAIGDGPGASSVAFTATGNSAHSTANQWTGITVELSN